MDKLTPDVSLNFNFNKKTKALIDATKALK